MPEAATGLGRMRRSEDGGGRPAETVLAVRRSEDARRPPASFREQEEDEFYELLQREREKVAPAARSSVALLPGAKGQKEVQLVKLDSLQDHHRMLIVDRALRTKDMDNEHFLLKLRRRLDRCGHGDC